MLLHCCKLITLPRKLRPLQINSLRLSKKKKFRKLCNRSAEKIGSNSTLLKKKLTTTKCKSRSRHKNKKGHLYHPVEGYRHRHFEYSTENICCVCKM